MSVSDILISRSFQSWVSITQSVGRPHSRRLSLWKIYISKCEVLSTVHKWEIRIRFKDPIFRTRYKVWLAVPFSGKKRVNLFRRALLEVVEGWKLLAPTASTRSMSGFCAAVDSSACATRISDLDISGFTLQILPMSAVLCGCSVLPIDTRYQVVGIRCSILLILAVSRLLPVLRIECDNARTVRVLFPQ